MADHRRQNRDEIRAQALGYGLEFPADASYAEMYQGVVRFLSEQVDHGTPTFDALLGGDNVTPIERAHAIIAEPDRVEQAMERWKQPADDDVAIIDKARTALPTHAEWTQIETMAAALAQSPMVKRRFPTQADVAVVLMAARDLGIAPTMAIWKIHPIEGQPSLSAELMVALVRRAGYSILPGDVTATSATAVGTRGDETATFSFTLDDAKAAGLVGKSNWKSYPKAMLWARAVSGICRMLFPDVLNGLTYTPDELGMDVLDAEAWEGAAVEAEADVPPDPAPPVVRDALHARVGALGDEAKRGLAARWKEAGLGSLLPGSRVRALTADEIDRAVALIAEFEVSDAQVVEDLPPCETDDEEEETPPAPVGKTIPPYAGAKTSTPDPTVEVIVDDPTREPDVDGVPDRGGPSSVSVEDPVDNKAARKYARERRASQAALDAAAKKFEDTVPVLCPECGKPNAEDNPACKVHPL